MPRTQKLTRKSARQTKRTPTRIRGTGPNGFINIIFDLDGTLVDVDALNKPPLPAPVGFPKSLITTNDFVDSKGQQMHYPMYLRPGVKQLLAYLLKNPDKYRVGVWTASFKNYSVGVVRKLFGEDYRQKLFCLLGTDEIPDPKTGEPMRVIENIFTGKHLPSRTVNKKVVKDLPTLFKEYPECHPGNTLLVDDLGMHKRENPAETQKCIYSIPLWDPFEKTDDAELVELLKLAKQHKLLDIGNTK
jgi:hypothetical protein